MTRLLILMIGFCVLTIYICQAQDYVQLGNACFDIGDYDNAKKWYNAEIINETTQTPSSGSASTFGTTPNTKIPIEWADIPAGTFMMGSPASEAERFSEEYQHQVSLNGFKMSKYEITFEQYDAFCEATIRIKPNDEGWGRGKRPVINVSWEDAVAFTQWIGGGSRLPTEAEWEYTCRAGTTTPFNTGNKLTTSQANYEGNNPNNNAKGVSRKQTLTVGSFSPNAWGVYDMHGNVSEWCLDWYDENYYKKSPTSNPQGPSSGNERVHRGGSWQNTVVFSDGFGEDCRSAIRNLHSPTDFDDNIGFRVILPSK